MKIGLVSNCWQNQLDAGMDLLELVTCSVQLGFRYIELRQTCLGRFEHGDDCIPDASALQQLPSATPELEFNIAINIPFLQPEASSTEVFAAAVDAAVAVAGTHRPHLRLVDLTTSTDQLVEAETAAVSQAIATLAHRMIDVGGQLSIEHSLQSWDRFFTVFRMAREALGDQRDQLRLCYDPVNLFFSDAEPDPGAVTRSLAAEEISMVHFKQRRDNAVLSRVDDGDVDWREQAVAFQQIGYQGPYLFEIRSSENLGEEMKASIQYVHDCGFTIPG